MKTFKEKEKELEALVDKTFPSFLSEIRAKHPYATNTDIIQALAENIRNHKRVG